jgi:hypothetical protein
MTTHQPIGDMLCASRKSDQCAPGQADLTSRVREFVRVWQSATSLAEVSDKLQLPPRIVKGRACVYRRRGVPLKKFVRSRVDWAAIAKYAGDQAKATADI